MRDINPENKPLADSTTLVTVDGAAGTEEGVVVAVSVLERNMESRPEEEEVVVLVVLVVVPVVVPRETS